VRNIPGVSVLCDELPGHKFVIVFVDSNITKDVQRAKSLCQRHDVHFSSNGALHQIVCLPGRGPCYYHDQRKVPASLELLHVSGTSPRRLHLSGI
jgi:hypothetical protein